MAKRCLHIKATPGGVDLCDHSTVNDNFDEDMIFGDTGNDWIVGGPDNDQAFGGWGADLMNMDDDHRTNGGLNDQPDLINVDIQDRAYGGQ